MSDNTYLVNTCMKCKEIMPLCEKVCYCEGPVIAKNVGLDEKRLSNYYPRRKFIYEIRRSQCES